MNGRLDSGRGGLCYEKVNLMLLAFMAGWMEERMNSPMELSHSRTLYILQCFLRQLLRVISMGIIVKSG